ncbi:MAG: transporter substrate-binding domain-containing protein, partial [Synergistaceae bacterium]|nr:transporter substrate-binding domain-containing protein [Synergistaceae bacterium]
TGKCDLTGSITWTEERAETMLYSSVPNAQTDIVLIVMNTQPAEKKPAPESASGLYTNIKDLAGKKVAVQTGTICDQITARFLPTAELVYFDTQTDLVTALKTNKADAICTDIPIAKYMMSEYSNMAMLGEALTEDHLAPIFAKTEAGRKLCGKFTEFTKAAWENGTIQELESIWFGSDDSRRILKDYSNLPAPNGKLRMAVDPAIVPFAYMKANRIIGYDVDFAVRFCEAYGYGLEIMPMNFSGMIPAVMSGKCDLAICAIAVTPERAENVLFSEPNAKSGTGFFVRKSDSQSQPVQTSGQYNSLEEIAGRRIAVQTGTASALLVEEKLPDAKIQYFDSLADTLVALKAGKVDALAATIFSASHMVNTNDDITILDHWLRTTDISPIFTKSDRGRKICEEYSEFIKGLWEDGTIDKLNDIWLGPDESRKIIKDYSNLPAPNGVIRLAVDTSMPPLAYVRDNKVVGYDIDLAVRFCEAKGYGLQITQGTVTAALAEVMSGKSDMSMSLMYTEERAENALFPKTPSGHSGNVIVVMKAKPESSEGEYSSFEELAGKNIGAQTGTPNGDFALKAIPTANIHYFDGFADIVTALKMRRIDAAALALNVARFMLLDNEDLALMGKPLAELDAAPIFAKTDKGRELCEQFNEFIKAQWDNGTLQELDSIWFGRDDSKRTPKDYASLPAPNGVLKMAVDTSFAPFAYVKDNRIVGYEIDCAVKFCQENGYGLEVIPMNFGAIIAAVQSGKCDFASSSIAITPERAEQVLFASPNAKTGCALVVRKAKPQPVTVQPKTETPSPAPSQTAPSQPAPQIQTSPSQISAFMEDASVFFEELKASFNRTFIREERWRLFVEGIINTMIITVLSILFGTILGFVVYLLCRGGNVFANLLTRFFIWLIEGTPMVVLLMILYYIIFGKVDIPGIWVAVIAFTMT